jgi:tRNA threonylcarbamoyladenosine biosynthesis protein TsaE
MKTYTIGNLTEIDRVAAELLRDLPQKRIVCFYGPMGSGKTTFIKALCKQLKVLDNVVSPTFALINEYKTDIGSPVYHFDFYRINKIDEVFDFGYEEYFYSDIGICFIEWPELVEQLLPTEGVVRLRITVLSNGSRLIEVE